MLHGIGVSHGIVRGVLYRETAFVPVISREEIAPGGRPGQAQKYKNARQSAEEELQKLIDSLQAQGTDKAAIFAAHQEILLDEAMEEEILEAIGEGQTADSAVEDVYRAYAKRIARAKDPVIRERAKDLDDVRLRLLRNLQGVPDDLVPGTDGPCIAAAEEWLPSRIARLAAAGHVAGIVAEKGSATCHAAIVCEALGLPALFGVGEGLKEAPAGTRVILDAQAATLEISPAEEQWREAGERVEQFRRAAAIARQYADRPAVTTDGRRVEICLNAGAVDLPPQSEVCDGVGLFRTEFLFMEQQHLPTEDEQYEAYAAVLRKMGGRPVILRTLDIGADKQLEYFPLPKEENPALGVRALRLCFDKPDLFRTQLRAAWRASAHGNLWLMFPMVGSLEDWRRAKQICLDVRRELEQQGAAVGRNVPIGAMIEIPSAALQADRLAAEADFASVGTNDLCQYLFAADRTNARVAAYAQSHSPVLMELLGRVAAAFEAQGKPLSVCGELGGDACAAAVLVGMGYKKLSMSPGNMPYVRQVICRSSMEELQSLARQVCAAATQGEAEELVQRFYQGVTRAPEEEAKCIHE